MPVNKIYCCPVAPPAGIFLRLLHGRCVAAGSRRRKKNSRRRSGGPTVECVHAAIGGSARLSSRCSHPTTPNASKTRKSILNCIAALVLFLAVLPAASAQQSYPMLMSLSPTAAQVGQSSEHTLESRYSMFGASQVLVSGEGVAGEIVTPMELGKDGKPPALTQIKLKFTVAADAMPGVRDFRIIGPTGPSTIGQLVITQAPVISEEGKNDTQETAQAVAFPCTICGCVEKAEDVDFYRFTVAEPVALTFHCLAMRLEDRIHDLQTHVDPLIAIRNAKTGSTLAAADNFFAADPFLSYSFEPGDYLLEVRDVRYQGNKYWNYAIEVSDRPFVSQVFPSIVSVGQSTALQLVGKHLTENTPIEYSAPSELSSFNQSDSCTIDVSLSTASGKLNPIPMVVTSLPVTLETDGDNNNSPAVAQPLSLPAAVSGRIESESDIDCFSFEAKKNDRISVEVLARRNGSELDSIVRILNEKGQSLIENDDMRLWGRRTLQDSMIENWAVPADGRYTIEIRDVHLRGGAGFVYGLELTRATPSFDLILDSDKTWLTPGSCAAIFVRAVRRNGFDGEIQLQIDGLPEGVKASCGKILAGTAVDGCIILEAAADQKQSAANVKVLGTASVTSEGQEPCTLTTAAQPMQEIYMPGGGRSHWPVELHTVAVGQPSDIRDVKLSTYDVTLKPGESVKIDVELVRAEGFDKNVTLDMLYQHLSSVFANTLPPGVSIDARNSQTLLTGTKTQGSITLTAAKDAKAVDHQQCCIMANVSINFVMKATYSSRPVMVTVLTP